ncbi:MAG: hypothetical protein AAF961_17120, partial [Planctomycetota bacterium]
ANDGAGCSYETCGKGKLQEFLKGQLMSSGNQAPAELVDAYGSRLAAALESSRPISEVEGLELE